MGFDEKRTSEFAEALGVTPDLVQYVPELLADIWALGSWPEVIVRLLRDAAALPPGARVIEVGCGKGAVAIPIARELGFGVRGIDLFPPFLQEAMARARSAGVSHRCCFEIGDIRHLEPDVEAYDVAVCAGVGAGVFGSYAGCVRVLRQTARRRGYLVVNDGFLLGAVTVDRSGYGYYRPHDETVRQLTGHGDRLVQEVLIAPEELKAYNRRNTELIRSRAKRLAQLHPEQAHHFERFIESEEAECEFLEAETTEAVWLLQRQ